jgi:hypothetical protein
MELVIVKPSLNMQNSGEVVGVFHPVSRVFCQVVGWRDGSQL